MSYGFRVYFVSIEQVEKVFGSNDRAFETAVVEAEGWDEDRFTDPPEVDEETVRWRRALRGILSGNVSDAALEETYGYALESICAFAARGTPKLGTCPFNMDYARDLDTAYDAASLPLAIRWAHLFYGGAPIPVSLLPFPSIGAWSLETMQEALPIFRAHDVVRPSNVSDPEVGWKELLSILESGVATKRDAVAFYG